MMLMRPAIRLFLYKIKVRRRNSRAFMHSVRPIEHQNSWALLHMRFCKRRREGHRLAITQRQQQTGKMGDADLGTAFICRNS